MFVAAVVAAAGVFAAAFQVWSDKKAVAAAAPAPHFF